jgi:hypothetical protein
MKNILMTSILLIAFHFTYSQVKLSEDFSYTIGKPYEVIDAAEKYYFHLGDYILNAKIDDDVLTIQKFDAKTLGFIKKIEVADFPKGYGWETITVFNNKFLIFYNSYDKENNTEQLFYRELDVANLSFIGKDKLLYSVKGKVTGTLYGKGYSFKTRDKFNFLYSYDSSQVMIQYKRKPVDTDNAVNHDLIGFSLFDKNFKQLWNKEVKMPYTEKKMEILDYSIDSDGNAYILSAVSDDNNTDIKKCINGKAGYHIELLNITASSNDINKSSITLKNKYINGISLFESPKNYMVCAGFYNKSKNKANVDGIFMFKAGNDGSIYDTAFYEIPLEIINQYASQKTQNKNDKKEESDKAELEDMVMKNIVIGADGSILLIGEQNFYIITTSTSSTGSTSSTVTNFYNDILVTKIGADGKLDWMKKLPKRQKGSKGKGGMSFKYINEKNNHYLLFLDNIKNQNLTINDVPSFHVDEAGGFLTAYKINDTNGEVSKHSIFDTKDVKGMPVYQFNTGRILPISSNEFIIEVYKKSKEDVLIKIAIKEK